MKVQKTVWVMTSVDFGLSVRDVSISPGTFLSLPSVSEVSIFPHKMAWVMPILLESAGDVNVVPSDVLIFVSYGPPPLQVRVMMSMPAKEARAVIKNKQGDPIFFYKLRNLSELFPKTTHLPEEDGEPRSDAVEFLIEGRVDGMQLSSHRINLTDHGVVQRHTQTEQDTAPNRVWDRRVDRLMDSLLTAWMSQWGNNHCLQFACHYWRYQSPAAGLFLRVITDVITHRAYD